MGVFTKNNTFVVSSSPTSIDIWETFKDSKSRWKKL